MNSTEIHHIDIALNWKNLETSTVAPINGTKKVGALFVHFHARLRTFSDEKRMIRNPATSIGVCTILVCCFSGCHPLTPKPIVHSGYRVSPELIADPEPIIERGKERPIIDAIGWGFGVPGRFLLWDPRIDNHRISHRTESEIAAYLAENDLHHVKVRLNQYAPLDDLKRLHRNKTVGWGYRYTLGIISVAGEAVIPGRIFGGDHYNPFTATAHIYSDIPAIGFHEAAHAKDFSRRKYPGTYALAYMIPGVPLIHERIATRDVMDYVHRRGDLDLQREAYRLLYPAYGTYVGGALGYLIPDYANPIYVGAVLIGHAWAHEDSYSLPEEKVISVETFHQEDFQSDFLPSLTPADIDTAGTPIADKAGL